MEGGATLTGLWGGLFSYPRALRPAHFTATLIAHGAGFSGSSEEVSEDIKGRARRRRAALSGRREGRAVTFLKRYDGAAGWSHAVHYAGRLSADGTEIEGGWVVPGAWSGRFLMVRGEGSGEAALRAAFERA